MVLVDIKEENSPVSSSDKVDPIKANEPVSQPIENEQNSKDTPNINETEKKVDEEVAIDFSELKNKAKRFFKKSEKKESEEKTEIKETPSYKEAKEAIKVDKSEKKNEDNNSDSESDEIAFDVNEIKNKAKNLFNKVKSIKSYSKNNKDSEDKDDDKEENIDLKKATDFVKKHSKVIIPILLIITAIFLSSYLRMMPSSLPITDGWAQDGVHNHLRNQIQGQINQQYPNLPVQNRNSLVEKEFQKVLQTDKEAIENNIAQLSKQYKANFQDENGDTYLLAIDPYLWLSQARNVIRHGHLGDKLIDGEPYFSLRDGRLDKRSSQQLHPYFGAYLYKLISFFFRDISLMRVIFLMPPIIIGLALIPAFLIGRKISGNIGGFFTAILLAINGPLLSRTPAGFADTDPYNILFPLIIAWLFIEGFTAKSNKPKIIYNSIAGLFVGLYALTWTGWSPIFLFILATLVLSPFFVTIINFVRNKIKKSGKSEPILPLKEIKLNLIQLVTFFLSSAIFVSLFVSFSRFMNGFTRPISFIYLKEVGIKSIWPNVLTTVAEFNPTSFSNVISQLGGNLMFSLSIVGILLTIYTSYKKGKFNLTYFFLISLWFIGTSYSVTKGARFSILIVPPFAIALGSFFGITYEKLSAWLKKVINLDIRLSKVLIFIVLALFIMTPLSSAQSIAKQQLPSMNDAWYNSLIKVKDTSSDAIITSWWDFGHWFQAISERRVTFDGGDQGQRIHWVGRTLLSSDEKETLGILRMLNCVQETAPKKLDEFTDDSLESTQILYKIFQISDRNKALKKYQELGLSKTEAETMLEYTHCQDLIPNYFITSGDMVGKAGVWGHFGSWDFRKATMYHNTNKVSRDTAVSYLTKKFGMSEDDAHRIHGEIQTTKGDRWIAPWPGYHSGLAGCDNLENNKVGCIGSVQGGNFAFQVDLNTHEVIFDNNPNVKPNSLTYATKTEIKEKKFTGEKTGFSIVLIPNGNSYQFILTDELQAASTFTKLFYYQGHGMKCFEKFDDVRQVTGGRIINWKVDYTCKQNNQVFFKEPVKPVVEPVEEPTQPSSQEANSS